MKSLKKILENLVTVMLLVSTGLIVLVMYLAVYGVMIGVPIATVIVVVYYILKGIGIL